MAARIAEKEREIVAELEGSSPRKPTARRTAAAQDAATTAAAAARDAATTGAAAARDAATTGAAPTKRAAAPAASAAVRASATAKGGKPPRAGTKSPRTAGQPPVAKVARLDAASAASFRSSLPNDSVASTSRTDEALTPKEKRQARRQLMPTMPGKPAQPTVMLVGTGERMDAAVTEALTRHGVQVEACASTAVPRAVIAAAPDLAVLLGDAATDGGRRVLKLLAGHTATSTVPVAVFGGEERLDSRLSAFRHGAVAIIPRTASADAVATRVADLARTIPERGGTSEGELGEATLDDLTELVKQQLRSGILSVGEGDESVRVVLGAGRPVQDALDDFVKRIRPLVARADAVRYELLEEPEARFAVVSSSTGEPREFGHDVFGQLRVLIVDNDPGRADTVAQELRGAGSSVVVTGTNTQNLDRARALDPHIMLLDAAALDGPDFDFVRLVRRDARLRWASLLLANWEELWPNRTLPLDIEELAVRIGPLIEQDANLEARVRSGETFDTRLEITGPSRLLRILAAAADHTVHVTVSSPKASIEVDVAEGLIVGALGTRPDGPPLEGSQAIAGLLVLSSARVRVEHRANPSVANMMTPADVAIGAADQEPPPIQPSVRPTAGDSVVAKLPRAPRVPSLAGDSELAADPMEPSGPHSDRSVFEMPAADAAEDFWGDGAAPNSEKPTVAPLGPRTVDESGQVDADPASDGDEHPTTAFAYADIPLPSVEAASSPEVSAPAIHLSSLTDLEEVIDAGPNEPATAGDDDSAAAPFTLPLDEGMSPDAFGDLESLPSLVSSSGTGSIATETEIIHRNPHDPAELREQIRRGNRRAWAMVGLLAVSVVTGGTVLHAWRAGLLGVDIPSEGQTTIATAATDETALGPAPRANRGEDTPGVGIAAEPNGEGGTATPEADTVDETSEADEATIVEGPRRDLVPEEGSAPQAAPDDAAASPANEAPEEAAIAAVPSLAASLAEEADAPAIDPERSADSLVREAEGLVRDDNIAAAAPLFERAQELTPRDNHVLNGMALVHLHRGDSARAVELAEDAVRMRSRRVEYRLTLARAYLANGQAQEARGELMRILRQEAGHSEAIRLIQSIDAE